MLNTKKALDLVTSIVKSPSIKSYNIGITCNPKVRRAQYLSVGFEHFAVIDFGLNWSQALKLEKALYEGLTRNQQTMIYKKYRKNARNSAHRPSLGGKKPDNTIEYYVYIAWWNKGSPGHISS